jgi:hypothetical protein
VLVWAWLLASIPFLTDVAPGLIVSLAFGGLWMVLAFSWLLLPLCVTACFRSPTGRRWYLAAALAGLLGLGLGFTDVGPRLRVAACEPALAAYIKELPPGGHGWLHGPRGVGLFVVDGTEECGGVVLLYTGRSYLDRYGLAYNSDGKPLPPRRGVVSHMYGPWYIFKWRF